MNSTDRVCPREVIQEVIRGTGTRRIRPDAPECSGQMKLFKIQVPREATGRADLV